MILTRLEWVTLLTSHWRHLLVTLFTRAADKLDLFTADHPLISLIAQSAEFLNIIWVLSQFLNEYKTVNVMLREPLKKKIFLQVSDLKERFWARDSYLPSYRRSFCYSSTNHKKVFYFWSVPLNSAISNEDVFRGSSVTILSSSKSVATTLLYLNSHWTVKHLN